MHHHPTRREFLRHLGLSAAAYPFICNLPSLGFENAAARKQRLVVMFSPNGTIPKHFWPDQAGPLETFKEILSPLDPYRDRVLTLNGVNDKLRGDGDSHMRGMGCLLTGIELFPGNVQGGSDTPAGWASGLSIDQEIKNFLQSRDETRTRFGSLEFGVVVPDRADTWTRMVYAGANKPIAPIDDPYQMFRKLYGRMEDREDLQSILDGLKSDLDNVSSLVSSEDRKLLEEHATFVRQMERELQAAEDQQAGHAVPQLEPGIREDNDNIPQISKMQIELMVDSFVNDYARIGTIQYTNSVGGARMRWLGIEDGHHALSHESDDNAEAVEKLTRINKWYCEQLAYLTKRLAETPEPGGQGTLLDNTLILWTNELGKGNSHTLNNIPWVVVGNGLDWRMGRALEYSDVAHNRLHLSLAHGFGHRISAFGNPNFCADGPLDQLT
jgi:hypothetical protein